MKRFFALLLLGSLLAACEDPVDVPVDSAPPVLVVEGWVYDTLYSKIPRQKIVLSTTQPFFDNSRTPRVTGAQVLVKEFDKGGTPTRTIRYEEAPQGPEGTYYADFQGKTGHTYRLEVSTPDGQEYHATDRLNRVPNVDALTYEKLTDHPFLDEGFFVNFNGPEPCGVGDNYRFKAYRNDTLFNRPQDLQVVQDDIVDGSYIGEVRFITDPYQVGDTARFELLSLSGPAYEFFVQLAEQTNTGGLFSTPPANVKTNIIAEDPDALQPAGWFGAAGMRFAIVPIQEDIRQTVDHFSLITGRQQKTWLTALPDGDTIQAASYRFFRQRREVGIASGNINCVDQPNFDQVLPFSFSKKDSSTNGQTPEMTLTIAGQPFQVTHLAGNAMDLEGPNGEFLQFRTP